MIAYCGSGTVASSFLPCDNCTWTCTLASMSDCPHIEFCETNSTQYASGSFEYCEPEEENKKSDEPWRDLPRKFENVKPKKVFSKPMGNIPVAFMSYITRIQ